MSVLVTGGMGFLGLHTVRRFLDVGEEVVATMHSARREPDFLKDDVGKGLHIEPMDITDEARVNEVFAKYKPTAVIHLAAPPPRGMEDVPEFHLNFDGLLNILEASRENGARRVQVASSQTVYGGLKKGPFMESDPLPVESALSVQAHKKAMEILSLHYASRTGMDVIIARVGGIYGPMYQTLNHPIASQCYAAAKGTTAEYGRGVPFTGDRRGYCYVKDCAAAIQLLDAADILPHRIYNTSGGAPGALTNGEIADLIRKVVPSADLPLQDGTSPNPVPDAYQDVTLAKEDAGYVPAYDIERGVSEYIDWLKTHDR
ncbi:MAG: NAD(P)-dependent oxidoreductase [Chloroflexi bacterium]|nr:NAD(P)-dependent oxidoreductase [Chloroflexota bacterium]